MKKTSKKDYLKIKEYNERKKIKKLRVYFVTITLSIVTLILLSV